MKLAHIFTLLVMFQLKHLLADYFWQGRYMLGKFKEDWNFIPHLVAHVAVHGAFTFMIAIGAMGMVTNSNFADPVFAFHLALFDASVHFVMDRIKAGPRWLGRFKPLSAEKYMLAMQAESDINPKLRYEACKQLRSNTWFWRSIGIDQAVHHLTHYVIIYFLVTFHR